MKILQHEALMYSLLVLHLVAMLTMVVTLIIVGIRTWKNVTRDNKKPVEIYLWIIFGAMFIAFITVCLMLTITMGDIINHRCVTMIGG